MAYIWTSSQGKENGHQLPKCFCLLIHQVVKSFQLQGFYNVVSVFVGIRYCEQIIQNCELRELVIDFYCRQNQGAIVKHLLMDPHRKHSPGRRHLPSAAMIAGSCLGELLVFITYGVLWNPELSLVSFLPIPCSHLHECFQSKQLLRSSSIFFQSLATLCIPIILQKNLDLHFSSWKT